MERLTETFAGLSPRAQIITRHVLLGESLIDSLGCFFDSRKAVDEFLQINEFDWNDSRDQKRLLSIHNEAVSYVEALLKRPLDPSVSQPDDVRDIFLLGSSEVTSEPIKLDSFPPQVELPIAKQACVLTKVMNTILHINGHELLYTCPISRRQLAQKVDDKIGGKLSQLKSNGFPLIAFEGGRKPKESLITKLLCKRTTVASRINDRLRYQIIVAEKTDVLKLVAELFTSVLPFNFLLPGSTINQLIDINLVTSQKEVVSQKARDMAHSIARSVSHLFPHSTEEMDYSGKDYNVLKFVVDVPVRLDKHIAKSGEVHTNELGIIVYSLAEFTIIDQATRQNNEQGENAHPEYKGRQKMGALKRMAEGTHK